MATLDYQKIILDSSYWLKEKVFPLWLREAVNLESGVFCENLSFDGKAQVSSRRALVQARQIYAFSEASKLGLVDPIALKKLIHASTNSFIKSYSLASGAFVHSVDTEGQHLDCDLDLYTQAFALFGLAHGYEITHDEAFKKAALKLAHYLLEYRQHHTGGFTEIKNDQVFFQSNPHMHLFEASIVWSKVDQDPVWNRISENVSELCVEKFIDSSTGLLAESFDENWNPNRENGKFIFEPGHHYEWSWLFFHYHQLKGTHNIISEKLFLKAEKYGLSSNHELVFDEVWSDGTIRKRSSRFWPQCERVKSAIVLGEGLIADRALQSLMKNFLLMDQGLWKDTILETGLFVDLPVKASSLYHIINAISEYQKYRSGALTGGLDKNRHLKFPKKTE